MTEESLMDRLNTDMRAASLSIDKACWYISVCCGVCGMLFFAEPAISVYVFFSCDIVH